MILENKAHDALRSFFKLECQRFYCLDCFVRCDLITVGSAGPVKLIHNGIDLIGSNFTTQG